MKSYERHIARGISGDTVFYCAMTAEEKKEYHADERAKRETEHAKFLAENDTSLCPRYQRTDYWDEPESKIGRVRDGFRMDMDGIERRVGEGRNGCYL
jgi:hypothetical protein